ncbi:MAG: cupin domain-containing protein [Deltaproteobacteria bacterium]|nr:cupin domain-containing protein [Deltaproteobacteria bacterium]
MEETDFDIGERLRTLRKTYGFSQRTLAKRADVTNGIISMIEQNRNSPSVATLKKILNAFPISLADFFTFGQLVQEKIVYSAAELVDIGSGGFSFRQVGTNMKDKAMQILHERIEPGADSGKEMLHHESEEGGVIICGQLELTVGGQTHTLGPGDAYYFNSRLPHRFRNIGTDECEIISCCSPPTV